MRTTSRQRRLLCCCVSAASLSIAACGSSQPPAAQPPPASVLTSTTVVLPSATVSSLPTPAAAAPSSSPVTTTNSPPATGGNAVAACATSKLVLAQAQNFSAHADTDVLFTLTNEAAAPCTLTGYPGVTLLNAAGTQVGPDATRHPSPVTVVTLTPGAKAQFHELDPQAACPDAPRAAQIRIFPPNRTASLTSPVQEFVCHPSVTAVAPYNPNEPTYVN
jgi:hypothetical protein